MLFKKFLVPGLIGLMVWSLIMVVFNVPMGALFDSGEPVPVTWKKEGEEPERDPPYIGETKNGEYHGEGVLTNPSGAKYVGQFKNGEFHGDGIYTEVDNSTYRGEWKNGKKHGHGTLTHTDGTVVEGEWAHGIQYDPETGEYSCETRPKIVETGNLRIEVYERNEFQPDAVTLEDGKDIPECWWMSDERFVVYRGETKLVEVDERGWIDDDNFGLRIRADYPRQPEDFPVVIGEDGYFEWKVNEYFASTIPPGYDITGDGSPNLLVQGYTGGAHCCTSYYLLDIGKHPRLIGELYTEHSGFAAYKLEGTPGLTLLVYDWNYAYWLTCFACSPAPDVYLSFDQEKDWFAVNTDMMKASVPEQETLEEWVEEIQQHWEQHPQRLWTHMLDLIYTGNLDAAKELMDRAWPADAKMKIPSLDESFFDHIFRDTPLHPTDKDKFWHGLLKKIGESQFAEEVFLMNAPHLCSNGPLLSLPYLERLLCTETER